MKQSYYSPGGGMTSPAVGYRASRSPARETMSPPTNRDVLPADWPMNGGQQQQATPAGFMFTPTPERANDREGSVTISQYAQLQADRATVEVKLNVAENKLKDAQTREGCLVNQLQRERTQHTQVCQYLLDACKSLSKQAEDLPDSVSSPSRAPDFARKLGEQLRETEEDRDVAIAASQAATAKVDQLTMAIKDRDICITSLETKLRQADTRVDGLEADVQQLLDQLRIAQTSPVGPAEKSADDSLLTWANTNETAVPPRQSPSTRGPIPAPPVAKSPARPIQTPQSTNTVNTSHASTNPQETTGEWPPSPRRQLNTSTMDSTLNDTLPEEFPLSPRRELPAENGPGEDWRQAGEEWPPSPRRSVQPEERHHEPPAHQQDWSNVTATPDQREWPPSPQRSRNYEQERHEETQEGINQNEWPPSPARARGREPEPEEHETQEPMGEEWPPSPARNRNSEMEVWGKEWPPSPQRERNTPADESPRRARGNEGERQDVEEGKEWPPSPRRSRDVGREATREAAPQVSQTKKAGPWPQSPRRTPSCQRHDLTTPDSENEPQYAESIHMEDDSPPRSEPHTTTPVDATNISQKLEYTPNSPKTKRDDLNDSMNQLGGRRRSVGFVDVPNEQHRKHSECSDVGAVRRSVDLIRAPSDLTPTAAKLRIAKLEKEIRLIKGEEEQSALEGDMKRRAEKAFNAVDALHQKDGSISKTELGRVLREDKLGAKVLFHELDGDDSGEIDIHEWLGWFGKLKNKDAAENMLEWIEERLEAVSKQKGVHFSRGLSEPTHSKAKRLFECILDRVNNEHFIYKPSLIAMLKDEGLVMKTLPNNDEQNVYMTHWISWLEEIDTSEHSSAASTLTWVESKIDAQPPQEAPAVDEAYNGPLSEEQRQRAVGAFHRLDELSGNAGVVTIETLLLSLQMQAPTANIVLKELYDIVSRDEIYMVDWIAWFDSLERSKGSCGDMLQLLESKLA